MCYSSNGKTIIPAAGSTNHFLQFRLQEIIQGVFEIIREEDPNGNRYENKKAAENIDDLSGDRSFS